MERKYPNYWSSAAVSQAWSQSSWHLSLIGPATWCEETIASLRFSSLDRRLQSWGGQHKQYKDVLKATMKTCNFHLSYMEGSEAVNRSSWCRICRHSTAQFESNRTAHLIAQHEARHAAATNPLPTSSSPPQYHVCPNCSKPYASCIRLVSHCRHKHCK